MGYGNKYVGICIDTIEKPKITSCYIGNNDSIFSDECECNYGNILLINPNNKDSILSAYPKINSFELEQRLTIYKQQFDIDIKSR